LLSKLSLSGLSQLGDVGLGSGDGVGDGGGVVVEDLLGEGLGPRGFLQGVAEGGGGAGDVLFNIGGGEGGLV